MSTSSAVSSFTTTIAPTDLARQISSQRQIGQKRKAAAAGIDAGVGNTCRTTKARFFTKRRAAKACQCCRARKVRCNVTEHGAPCTNCRLDEVECVVSEGRRKRKLPGLNEKNGNINILLPQCETKEQPRRLSSHSSVIDWLDDEGNSEEYGYSCPDHYPQQGQKLSLDTQASADVGNMIDPALRANQSTLLPEMNPPLSDFPIPQPATIPLRLPKYVSPIPNRFEPDEVYYLQMKGAFFVPHGTVLGEFLHCFVEFVHHSNPVVELHDILKVIQSDGDDTGKVSLLVLQAMFYGASAFVDIQFLRCLGYKTRKEARQQFYSKVKLLYDFGYETDRLALVQALSLISDHYERPNDLKDAHYWLSIAVSTAKSIGLQQDSDETRLSAKDVKLRKRLWWALVARDRLVALGMRRPTLIKSEDYQISTLTVDDLQFAPLPEHLACMFQKSGSAKDAIAQRRLAVLYLEKVKLCCLIGNVLQKTYCVTNESRGLETDRANMMLRPRTSDLHANEVMECHTELNVWLEGLPHEACLQDNENGFSDHASVTLSRSMLHMLFHAAISALHRPQVLLNNNSQNCMNPTPPTSPEQDEAVTDSSNNDMLKISRHSVRHSTSSITAITAQLAKSGLAHFLPVTGITVLVAAMVIHLLDLKSPTSEVNGLDAANGVDEGNSLRADALKGFCTCISVMRRLSDKYAAADVSTVFLDAAVRRARIRLVQLEEDLRPTGDTFVANANTEEKEEEEYVSSAASLLIAGQRLLGLPFVSDVPSSPSPTLSALTAVAAAPPPPTTSNNPLNVFPSYPTYFTASLGNATYPYQISGLDFMTAPAQIKDLPRGRTTLSSLTPPPDELLSFASFSSSPNVTKHTQVREQQQQQQTRANLAVAAAATAAATANNGDNNKKTLRNDTTASNRDDIDMAHRLERYLAGFPFSTSSSSPSAATAAAGGTNPSSIPDPNVITTTTAIDDGDADDDDDHSSSGGSRAGRDDGTGRGVGVGVVGGEQFLGTSGGTAGDGSDGTATSYYGQLESEFDALIDLSAGAGAGACSAGATTAPAPAPALAPALATALATAPAPAGGDGA